MKFTLALSLATLAVSAPLGGDPTKLVAGAVAGAGAVVAPLGVAAGVLAGAGLQVHRRDDLAIAAGAAAYAHVPGTPLGTIPVHVSQKRAEGLDVVQELANEVTSVVTNGAQLTRRDLDTIGALIVPVQGQVKVLVAQLTSKTVTLEEVTTIVPQLTLILGALKGQLALLKPVSDEVSAVLGTDSTHTIAVKLAELVDDILSAVDCAEIVLVDAVPQLTPVVIALNYAIGDVLLLAIELVDGLVAEISSLPVIPHIAATLKHLGLQLNVGIADL